MEKNRIHAGSRSEVTRPFFCIHLTTILFATLIASLLLYGNVVLAEHGDTLDPEIDIAVQFTDGCRQLGWPVVACYVVTNEDGTRIGKFNAWLACWDLAEALAILTLVIVPLEWAERRRPWLRWHVCVGTMLVACIAMLSLNEGNAVAFFGVMVAPILAALLAAVVFVTRKTRLNAVDERFTSRAVRNLNTQNERGIAHE